MDVVSENFPLPSVSASRDIWNTWAKLLIPLLVPTLIALITWLATQLRRRSSLRGSYLAQIESLKTLIHSELAFLGEEAQRYTWFPILPYFRGGDAPWAAAGLLSAREVAAVVAAHSAYRERLAYIAAYGTARQKIEGVDDALGIEIYPGAPHRETYRYDLEQMQREITCAYDVLGRAGRLGGRLRKSDALRAASSAKRPAYERP